MKIFKLLTGFSIVLTLTACGKPTSSSQSQVPTTQDPQLVSYEATANTTSAGTNPTNNNSGTNLGTTTNNVQNNTSQTTQTTPNAYNVNSYTYGYDYLNGGNKVNYNAYGDLNEPAQGCITKSLTDPHSGIYGVKLRVVNGIDMYDQMKHTVSCDSIDYPYVSMQALMDSIAGSNQFGGGGFGSMLYCYSPKTTQNKTVGGADLFPIVSLVNGSRRAVRIDCRPLYNKNQHLYYKTWYDGDMTLYGSIKCCKQPK